MSREDVAQSIKDKLLPRADVITPNAFELGWLTGRDVRDRETARAACRTLPGKSVVVTSLPRRRPARNRPVRPWRQPSGDAADTDRAVPNGTGDLLAGFSPAAWRLGRPLAKASGFAVAAIEHVIAASVGTARLDLAAGLKDIASVKGFAAAHG